MICLLTENRALKRYLESLLEENGILLCQNKSDAALLVVDLDTVKRPESDKRVLTISGDVFVLCDLMRPFLQEDFLALVKEKCDGTYAVADLPAAKARPTTLSYEEGVFYLNGERVTLTPAEHNLLYLLYQNRDKVVPFSACAKVLGGNAGKGNISSVYINHLRRKIDYPLQKRMIITMRNEGYLLLSEA